MIPSQASEALAAAKTEEIKAGTKQIETKKEEKAQTFLETQKRGKAFRKPHGKPDGKPISWVLGLGWNRFTTANSVAGVYKCPGTLYIGC